MTEELFQLLNEAKTDEELTAILAQHGDGDPFALVGDCIDLENLTPAQARELAEEAEGEVA